ADPGLGRGPATRFPDTAVGRERPDNTPQVRTVRDDSTATRLCLPGLSDRRARGLVPVPVGSAVRRPLLGHGVGPEVLSARNSRMGAREMETAGHGKRGPLPGDDGPRRHTSGGDLARTAA